MDVDSDGNFIYVGGGLLADHIGGDNEKKAHNAYHRTPTGWLASLLLSDVGGGHNPIAPEEEGATTLVQCASLPVPVQALHLRGNELITGGPQPLLTYWRNHNLGSHTTQPSGRYTSRPIPSHDSTYHISHITYQLIPSNMKCISTDMAFFFLAEPVSSMETSSQSIFAIASYGTDSATREAQHDDSQVMLMWSVVCVLCSVCAVFCVKCYTAQCHIMHVSVTS